MARQKGKFGPFEEGFEDFVPAAFARSRQEAEEYREILNDHDIPAIIGTEDLPEAKPAGAKGAKAAKPPRPQTMTHGVPVLVPEAMLDEASEVIAERNSDGFLPGEEEDIDEEEDEEADLQPEGPLEEAVIAADDEDDAAVDEDEEDGFAAEEDPDDAVEEDLEEEVDGDEEKDDDEEEGPSEDHDA